MRILGPEQAYAKSHFQFEEDLTDAELEIERTLVRQVQEYKPKSPKTKKFKKETHERAIIAEAIIADRAEKDNWFGENCFIALASEYDDVYNHTDLILEFDEEGGVTRLAVDVTTAENYETLEKKRINIRKDIESGKLTSLKYFISEIDDTQGKISGLPRIIINISKEDVKELSELIVNKENKKLSKHPIQDEILQDVKDQLESELEYAEIYFKRFPKNKSFVLRKHRKALEIINKIIKEKSPELEFSSSKAYK